MESADSSGVGGQAHQGGPARTVSLGGGRVVPYPEPLDVAASNVGRANRRADTKPEVLIRSALHRRGYRFRKGFLLRAGGIRVRPDVVFTRWKVAVFIDGCFWHRCPDHGTEPKRNANYWGPKLRANVDRDRRVNEVLSAEGWAVVRVWEHEAVEAAVDQIASTVSSRREHLFTHG
jgi:DNA mismatch endonuclease (patch repair protein)